MDKNKSPKQCFDKQNPKQCFDINSEREHLRYVKSKAELLFRVTKTLPSGLIERTQFRGTADPGTQKYRIRMPPPYFINATKIGFLILYAGETFLKR
ncbi:hypothetical protein CEXT_285281 [Caerostris extrusa]|uniref:Uncharacterized protein n=1 Tax=Caerostris extrusa TaxID=172846 RepID=A0AAV4XHQ1_CAEEX|nr:hypothetical protein CEXT_285281 [Caerostris extrusa]